MSPRNRRISPFLSVSLRTFLVPCDGPHAAGAAPLEPRALVNQPSPSLLWSQAASRPDSAPTSLRYAVHMQHHSGASMIFPSLDT